MYAVHMYAMYVCMHCTPAACLSVCPSPLPCSSSSSLFSSSSSCYLQLTGQARWESSSLLKTPFKPTLKPLLSGSGPAAQPWRLSVIKHNRNKKMIESLHNSIFSYRLIPGFLLILLQPVGSNAPQPGLFPSPMHDACLAPSWTATQLMHDPRMYSRSIYVSCS